MKTVIGLFDRTVEAKRAYAARNDNVLEVIEASRQQRRDLQQPGAVVPVRPQPAHARTVPQQPVDGSRE